MFLDREMKVIKGKKQVALVLSRKEFKYLSAALGGSSKSSVEQELEKTHYYGKTEPMPPTMGQDLWNVLRIELQRYK